MFPSFAHYNIIIIKYSLDLSLNLKLSILSENYFVLGSLLQSKEHKPTYSSTYFLSLLYIPLSIKDQLIYSLSLILSSLVNNLDDFLSSEITVSPPLSILPFQHMEKQKCRQIPQVKKISKCLYNQQKYFCIKTLFNGSNPEWDKIQLQNDSNTAYTYYGISLLIWR